MSGSTRLLPRYAGNQKSIDHPFRCLLLSSGIYKNPGFYTRLAEITKNPVRVE